MSASQKHESEEAVFPGYGPPRVARAASVTEGYERWASTYDHGPNPLLAREERHLFPLLTGLRDKRILDLACGTGRWLAKLVAQSESGVGLDCSRAMLRVAAKKHGITGRLAQAAGESLPFRGDVFDLVICSFAIGHMQDLGSLAAELSRVAKAGAHIFVSDLHPTAYERGWRVGFRDGSGAAEIEISPRSTEEIVLAFRSDGFECLSRATLCLEEPERHFFLRAGKLDSFAAACDVPAIVVFHFRRIDSYFDVRSTS